MRRCAIPPVLALAILVGAVPVLAHAQTADRTVGIVVGGQNIIVANSFDGLMTGGSCTLHIDGQALPTFGHGELEAYRCGGMREAGTLGRRHGHERMAIIYEVGGSPGVDFRTAIVIERVAGRWRIDEDNLGIHDDGREARSIEALRRWYRSRRR